MSQLAYRHDLRCPHCGPNWMPQYGTPRWKQTWRRGDGKNRYTPEGNRHYYSQQVENQVARMYVEGGNSSAIGRILGVRLETVYSWIQKKPPRLGRP